MRVSVYKEEAGGFSVLVQASPGKGRSPVLLNAITLKNIKEKVLPAVENARRPKGASDLIFPL